MSPLYDHATAKATDTARLRELRAEGYRIYATGDSANGEARVHYLQRPRPTEGVSAETPTPGASRGASGVGSEVATGLPAVSALGLGSRADAAFAAAGYETAADVLALSDDELAGIAGVGPATIAKLQSLR